MRSYVVYFCWKEYHFLGKIIIRILIGPLIYSSSSYITNEKPDNLLQPMGSLTCVDHDSIIRDRHGCYCKTAECVHKTGRLSIE